MSLRWQQIRSHAAAVRAAYAEAIGALVPALLPLEDLAQRLFNLSAFDDATLGATLNAELNPQLGVIRLRPNLPPTRRRFVLAHELGHVVLEGVLALFEENDATIDESVGGADNREAGVLRSNNTRERAEREANLFALELLVPADVLRETLLEPGWNLLDLAARFGVSPHAMRAQIVNVCCVEPPVERPMLVPPVPRLTPDLFQQAAVDAPLPTLVVAGPGTGKTRTIVAKYLSLIKRGIDPNTILALTFSNKAAEEMRDRIAAALHATRPDLAARVDVSTFHAWGLNALRQWGAHLDLPPDARLRSSADLYVLLRRRLAELPLVEYKNIREPGLFLRQIIGAISRAKDNLITPAVFRQHAIAEAERLVVQAEAAHGGKTTKTAQREIELARRNAARLHELANIYERYTVLLREESALDYGDLIALAVEALRIPAVDEAARKQHQYILVDEFQDINDASGELLRLLDGGRGRVWAVGDPWQSIYRFRGASPANLAQFAQHYPGAVEQDLRLNYRSLQPILHASHAIMSPDPLFAQRPGLLAHRHGKHGRVVEWVCADAEAETTAIADDILRRTRTQRLLPTKPRRKTQNPVLLRLRAAVKRERRDLRDHAILCRTHAQANHIAAYLRARGVPVDLYGELLDDPNVKDALALFGMGANESVATLRALTIPGFALDVEAIETLIRHAATAEKPLAQIVRDTEVVSQLDHANRFRLQTLLQLATALAEDNAWHALVCYAFEQDRAQSHVAAALQGDQAAQRALGAIGELIQLARSFVREAPEHAQTSTDFLAYVGLLSEGGERIAVSAPPNQANVVRVMTVHAAKGLEFPVVYVPGLQEGVFPPRRQYGSIPALPVLANESEDSLSEERYLLYVAMTRACDRLVLLRAATKRGKPVRRSPLLPGGEDGATAPWPVQRRAPRIRLGELEEGERLRMPPLELDPIPASALETYERCPRQFFYRYGFGLREGESGAYGRMHQAIHALASELNQHAEAGTLPPENALPSLVAQTLVEHKLTNVLYNEDYAAEALARTRQRWRDLQAGATPEEVGPRYTVKLPSGSVSVPIDRVEAGENGPRFVRARTGAPRDDDHLSTRIALYGFAQQQAHGGTGEVALHYTTSGTERTIAPKPAALAERATGIDALLQRIAAGDWTPNFGQQCATCPFVLICPV